MRKTLVTGVLLALALAPDLASAQGRSRGGAGAGWGAHPRGNAVPRGGPRYAAPSAAYRHPRAHAGGWGGYGYGYGYGGYGRHRAYGYGAYPYYRGPYASGYFTPWGFGFGVAVGQPWGHVAAFYGSPAPYYAAVPYYAAPAPAYVAAPYADAAPYSAAPAPAYSMGVPVPAGEAPAPAERAEVQLHVVPADAAMYVDGEFRGTAREVASLRLTPGRHHVEVTRPGYRVAERTIDVEAGTLTSIRIELQRP
jgi:hypothetical protein